jgi:hypothetical protein
MKYLQSFSLFESRTPGTLSKRQEAFLHRYTKGTWSVNPATGLVDVQGTFDCWDDCHHDRWNPRVRSLRWIKFGTVTGDFHCADNEFTTLAGAPRTVEGNFDFSENYLTSLEGAPQTVEGDFDCSSNELTTLEGAPRAVTGDFDCAGNKLTSLKGAPQTVGGDFDCSYNQLTTLEGAPQTVEGEFFCDAFELEPGKWNLAGWLQVLHTGSPEAQNLIQTIIGADGWNSEISSNPVGTLLRLAALWDRLPEDIKGGIKIPSDRQNDFDNFLDLERAGIF